MEITYALSLIFKKKNIQSNLVVTVIRSEGEESKKKYFTFSENETSGPIRSFHACQEMVSLA